MDQRKIGNFIASQRKSRSLTQAALAEKLGITDRAVSKWERGKGLPDASLMLDLCAILGISVNELLCGEAIETENTAKKNEELLLNMANEAERMTKMIRTSRWVIMIVSITSLLLGTMAAALLIPEGIWQLLAVLGLCVFFLLPVYYTLKLEVSVGAYKCKNCGHETVPTYSEALRTMHCGSTRYLKCPVCGKRTWCKKVWAR